MIDWNDNKVKRINDRKLFSCPKSLRVKANKLMIEGLPRIPYTTTPSNYRGG